MRSSDTIKSDIRILHEKMQELQRELDAAALAECVIPYRVGQVVTWRNVQYEISEIKPWGRENAWLKGFKLKKNGKPGKVAMSITSVMSLKDVDR